MSIVVHCFKCGKELDETGGLLFTPPYNACVVKYHLCRGCWNKLLMWIRRKG